MKSRFVEGGRRGGVYAAMGGDSEIASQMMCWRTYEPKQIFSILGLIGTAPFSVIS
jgi:hypothetical protein